MFTVTVTMFWRLRWYAMTTINTTIGLRSRWHWMRIAVCLAFFLSSVITATYYCYQSDRTYAEIQRIPAADSQKFTEAIKTGIIHTSDASQRFAQTLLLIAAALWGVIIGKENERKIIFGNPCSIIMAVSANLVVGMFLYSYQLLDTVISKILFKAAMVGNQEYIINLDNMRLSVLFSYQICIFVAAVVSIGSTLLCAHEFNKEN